MKKYLVIPLALLISVGWAQTKPVKIVFDVTSKEESVHDKTLRHVQLMSEAYPDSQFEVVIYGGAINMALEGKSIVSEQIASFKQNDNVSFKVCEGTMKRYDLTKSQLLTGVETVPDGILEIVTRQSEGWGYIKEIP
jgi:intracellular sulfur oxidation DsrE/DsrF family protein